MKIWNYKFKKKGTISPHLSILLPGADLLHLLQDLLCLINVALGSELLSLGQQLTDFLVQLMNLLCLQHTTNNLHLASITTLKDSVLYSVLVKMWM